MPPDQEPITPPSPAAPAPPPAPQPAPVAPPAPTPTVPPTPPVTPVPPQPTVVPPAQPGTAPQAAAPLSQQPLSPAAPIQPAATPPRRSSAKIILIVVSGLIVLAVLVAVLSMAAFKSTSKTNKQSGAAGAAGLRALSTPCYGTKLPSDQQNDPAGSSSGDNACHSATKNSDGSDTYEIVAENNPALNESNVADQAQSLAQSFVKDNGGSKITGQKSAKIDGSPASIVTLSNDSGGTATIALVYHVSNGYNSYSIDRFVDQGSSDLGSVTKDWQWK